MKSILNFLLTALILISNYNFTRIAIAEDVIATDVTGLADPQGLKRMEGSILILGESKAYDEFIIPTQRIEFDYNAQKFKEWQKIKIEGSRDTVFYRLPRDASTLEVSKSYEDEFVNSGFEIIYKGSGNELDDGYGRFMKEVYGTNIGSAVMEYHLPASQDYRYLAVKKNETDGSSTYITGLFAKIRDVWGSRYAKPGEVITRLDLIKTRPLNKRLVLVKAEEMPNLLGNAGKVVLYGILFDFNRTEIKPESQNTILEIAKFLESNSNSKLVVTGHTDNVGTFEFNRELSQKRADAVVNYLVEKHKISKARLLAFGASFAAPVAANESEEGKAKNRRVELVQF